MGARKLSALRPTMDANGVNMVAIGLEQLGAQEFIDGNFFDGGVCVLTIIIIIFKNFKQISG